jgi:hypothetical protein
MITTSIIIGVIGGALPFSALSGSLGFVPLPLAYWPPLLLIVLS